MSKCVILFQEILNARPADTQTLLNWITLLQKVQLARKGMGISPQASISEKIIDLCKRVIEQNPRSIPALRILSLQYRYKENYEQAYKLLEESLEYLLDTVISLNKLKGRFKTKCNLLQSKTLAEAYAKDVATKRSQSESTFEWRKQLEKIREEIDKEKPLAQTILEELKNNPLNPKLKTLLDHITKSEHLSSNQKTSFLNWMTFIINDIAFVYINEGKRDQLNMSINLLQASAYMYTNVTAHSGLAKIYDLLGDQTKRKECLETSYKIEPSHGVLKDLQNLGYTTEQLKALRTDPKQS